MHLYTIYNSYILRVVQKICRRFSRGLVKCEGVTNCLNKDITSPILLLPLLRYYYFFGRPEIFYYHTCVGSWFNAPQDSDLWFQ